MVQPFNNLKFQEAHHESGKCFVLRQDWHYHRRGAGNGKAIAKQFVDMGGKAVIVDINPETAAKTCEELGNAVFYIVDLGNPDEVVRVFQQIIDEQGKVEVLINNAGIVNTSDFDKLTLAEWNKILAVDLTAVFLSSQVLFRHMEAIGGGRIVNVASIAGKVGGGYLGTAAYAAAKAGVISLTKSIAKAGSSKNIYCNSLCPAYTKTPLVTILTGEKEQRVLDAMSLHGRPLLKRWPMECCSWRRMRPASFRGRT